ncbi:hypothetical protein G6F56_009144 [Rhizopus delemar]|nr:hypothetical protein G6F56_009144 [Rhizopus delemar]
MHLKSALFCLLVYTALWVEPNEILLSNRELKSNIETESCESLEVAPELIVPGGQLNISAIGILTQPIQEGAYADAVIKFGLVKLVQNKLNICKDLTWRKDNMEVQCPVEKGSVEVINIYWYLNPNSDITG